MSRSRAPTFASLCILLVTCLLLSLPAPPAVADWDEGQTAKWVQLPDLSTMGMDVDCSPQIGDYILADDFQCTETGPITAIHIWGSWYHDGIPFGANPDSVAFTVSIHADIPAGQQEPWSIPGELLWMRDFAPGEFTIRVWADSLEEGWLSPPEMYEPFGDTVCWQVNFPIPESEAFIQQGTPEQPVVYWLDIKAHALDPEVRFGWKTSRIHWNDDAVFGQGMDPYTGPWLEMRYPPGHELAGESLDLAFVIVSEPEPQTYKWLQEPDLTPFGMDVDATYEDHILADDFLCTETGYITGIRVWGSWLQDIWPDPTSVKFTLSIHADIPAGPNGYSRPGDVLWMKTFDAGTYQAAVWARDLQEGWLNPPDGYLFPGDTVCWVYDFTIPMTEAFLQQGSPDQPVVYWLDVKVEDFPPVDSAWGWKTSQSHWNDDAVYGNGFEPYPGPWFELVYPPGHELAGQSVDLAFALTSEPSPENFDWGDAPDAAGALGYPTLAIHNGANHLIVPGYYLGASVDSETDGQPDATATGDDLAGSDDEDGVLFTGALHPNQPDTVIVTASAPGFVDAWIDFDGNRSWLDPGEQILVSVPVVAGPNSLVFHVPGTAQPNITTFARFRFSSTGGLPPGGPAPDGEVEDYAVAIEDRYIMKWNQLPDSTETGLDVAMCPMPGGDYILADDFLCTGTGPLTDFRIWTSWLGDYLPFFEDPMAVEFEISIHADIPDTLNPDGYSMPGEVLWIHHFAAGEFRVEPAFEGPEGWLEPPDLYQPQSDFQCWRYDFHVDPHLAFIQEGSPTHPVVYWLDVKAFPLDPEACIGWKTSLTHWNDDAVWGIGPEPYLGPWFELRYPPNHPLTPWSIDLAFQILEDTVTGVPGDEAPRRAGLRQNAPNPFNPRTEIAYTVPVGGEAVRLAVYDLRGHLVRVLVDGFRPAGEHKVAWDGKDETGRTMPAGVYFARLRTGTELRTIKMSLVR